VRRFVSFALTAMLVTTLATPITAQAAPAEPASIAGELLVGFRPGVSAADRANARAAVGAAFAETVVPGTSRRAQVDLVRFPATMNMNAAIRAFEANPNVAYAEPNWVLTTAATSSDPFYTGGQLWGMYGDTTSTKNEFGSKAGQAWAKDQTGSKSIYVGVIDEGIDFNHPDLNANVWVNPFDPVDGVDNDGNGYVDDVRGWDFAFNNNTIYDGGNQDKHGTHVSGTIGARSNSIGVVGVSWDVTLISAKFLGPSGGSTANAVRAVNYFTDLKVRHGLNIVATNNSWGGGGYSQSLHDAIIRAAKQDILFIAAAGNSSSNNDLTTSYPSGYRSTSATSTETAATYDSVVAVAAIDSSGNLAGFSSFGATTVDLGAPGVGIISTLPGNNYAYYNGTSMATPHVTGAAALIAAATCLRGSELRTRLLQAVSPTASLSGKTATGGRLDLSDIGPSACAPPDTTVPTITAFTANPATVNVGATVTLTAAATDNVGVTSFVIARGATTLASSSTGTVTATWTPSAPGSYSFTATASDAAGNSTTQSVTVTATAVADTVAPSVGMTATSSSIVVGQTTTLTATATDNVGVTSLAIKDNSGATVGGSSYTFAPSAPGSYTFTAEARDAAGNVGTASIVITVSAATASATSVSGRTSVTTNGGKSGNNNIVFTVTATDNLGQVVAGASVAVTIQRNGSDFRLPSGTTSSAGTVIFTIKNALNGTYTLDITSIAAAGLTFINDDPLVSVTK